jgi:hypothetical protein
MLSVEDLEEVFNSMPREFVVIVGTSRYNFNLILLASFSSVVRSLNPGCNEIILPFKVSDAAVEEVSLLIHGKQSKLDVDPFGSFLFAAALDLRVVSERVSHLVEETTTVENFQERFDLLSAFADFLDPLSNFAGKNPDFFKSFAEGRLFSPPILGKFLSCDSLWNGDEEKFQFGLNHGSGDWQAEFFTTIRGELSERILYQLKSLICDRTHIHSFAILLNLCHVRAELEAELSAMQINFSSQIEIEFNSCSSINVDLKRTSERLWEDLLYRRCMLTDIDRALKAEMNKIEKIVLSLEALRVLNANFVELADVLTRLDDACNQLCGSTADFGKPLGKFLYPSSCPESVDYSRDWRTLVMALKEKVMEVVIPEDVIHGMKNRLLQIQREIESLFPGIDDFGEK